MNASFPALLIKLNEFKSVDNRAAEWCETARSIFPCTFKFLNFYCEIL